MDKGNFKIACYLFGGLMKFIRILKSFFLVFVILLFTSCSTFNASLESLLISPKVENIVIEGTWTVDKFFYMYKKNYNATPEIPLNSYFFISKDYVRINDMLINYEKYKVKSTTLKDYMRIKFKISDISFLNLEDKEIDVFSIQDSEKKVYELLKYDENTLLFYYNDDIMYLLNKVSDKIDESLEDYVKNNYKNNIYNDNLGEIVDTGFLISFKSQREVKDSSIPKSSYKSIWFYQNSDGVYSYKVFDNIMIPKNGELLTLRVESSEKNSLYEKLVVYKNVFSKDKTELHPLTKYFQNPNEEFINQFIDVNYVNDNFIGIEYEQNTEYLGEIKNDKLAMLSIEEPYISKRLKFSDIFPNNTKDFNVSRKKFLNLIGDDVSEFYDSEVREDSFKLLRYAGSWFLKGRINSKTSYDIEPIDFDIDVLPNEKLVKNNNSSVNLGQIKLKQSEVVDAFVSPNGSIIFMLTNENLFVYRIVGDKISTNTIGEFPIEKGDTVISSNWYFFDEAIKINKMFEEIK